MSQYTLCELDDIHDDSSKGFVLASDGVNKAIVGVDYAEAYIFAVKKEGAVFIYRNRCPHLGVPLEWMPDQFLDRDGQYIQCATHGALFRIRDGLCVSGPCPGESLTPVPFQIQEKSIIIDSSSLE